MSVANCTGRWIGHYLQQDQMRPITADVVQVGDVLSGSMRDGHPDTEFSLFEAAAAAGLPPGADEQIEESIRKLVPNATVGPIRYVSHLPTDSVLAGCCRGQTVTFLKTYQGTTFGGYKIGDQLIGIERTGHAVHYEGQLSPDGCLIDGRWWINAEPALGMPHAAGLFTLRRGKAGEFPSNRGPVSEGMTRPWWRFWSS